MKDSRCTKCGKYESDGALLFWYRGFKYRCMNNRKCLQEILATNKQ